jgi:signal transduction histidine kinase
MKLSFERIFILFFLLVIIGVVTLGVVNFNTNRSYFESTGWVEHTNEVLKQSTMVLSNLQDLGVRGYITTGDTSFLESYKSSRKIVIPRIDSLKELAKDNPVQGARVDSLRSYALYRLDICKKYIALFNQRRLDTAALAAFTLESRANMAHIRGHIGDIMSDEGALLRRRKDETEKNRHDFNLSVALIFAEVVMLLIGILVAVIFYFYHRKKYEANILKLNADLAKNVVDLNYANKELESFSYSVSHDLRAPLRIIDGFARILSEEYKQSLDAEAARFIQSIRSNAQHMGQLIDDLLNFSRVSRQELSMHDTDMNMLVDNVAGSLNALNKNTGADIQIAPLKNAKCDESLIKQVWMNLVSNALKYSRKKDNPVIKIGSEETATEVIYHVSDNGVGFDMEYADKLFGVFQRLHKASDYEGTGVGLALAYRIVARHKGRVWADSKPGEGAIFYFSLPK